MARVSANNIADGWPERAARLAVTVTWAGARVISIALLLIVWELVARSGIVTPFQLPALSRVLVYGIPLEELLFGFTFGLYWTGVYEHFTWNRTKAEADHSLIVLDAHDVN